MMDWRQEYEDAIAERNALIARVEAAESETRRLTDAQISEDEPDIDWLHIVAEQRNKAEAERDALAAEVERLRAAEESANHDAARLVYEVARLGIAYEGDDPLARLVEEIASLREQLDAAPVRFIDGRGYRVIPTEWWTGVGVSFEPPAPRQE